MKNGFLSCAVAGTICALAGSLQAAPIVNLLGDTGNLQVQKFTPPSITNVTLVNPYGAPPLPTLVVAPNGGSMSFVVTSDFLASATGTSGGKISTMKGTLDLMITFSTPVQLTVNLFEDGIFSKTNGGTVDVTGKVTVTEADDAINPESHLSNFPNEIYNASGTWNLSNQVTGFAGKFSSYKISIDNSLIASALGTTDAAYLAKKDFTLVFTTDGSGGSGNPSPEPASLGVLALGAVGLLARRRR